MSQSKLAQRPHWLVTKHTISQLEVLTIGSEDGEQVLPIFSFEEEAQLFLRFHDAGTDWKVRETSVGELASILYGPCADVSKVALDPIPEVCGGALLDLLSIDREEFVGVLVEDKFSAPRPDPSQIKRSVLHSKFAHRTTHVAARKRRLFRL